MEILKHIKEVYTFQNLKHPFGGKTPDVLTGWEQAKCIIASTVCGFLFFPIAPLRGYWSL